MHLTANIRKTKTWITKDHRSLETYTEDQGQEGNIKFGSREDFILRLVPLIRLYFARKFPKMLNLSHLNGLTRHSLCDVNGGFYRTNVLSCTLQPVAKVFSFFFFTQTSMEEASRRQTDDSDGTSWRLISFPSSRNVCSLEKLVTSTTLQKLPSVNSGGERDSEEVPGLTSVFHAPRHQ